MRWATRAGCHIDRAACAWLIRRFLDPEAEFVFVADPDDVPADATPFDMRGAELSHHQGDCSFERFLRHFSLEDPVLWDLARIVHEADLADERYDAPEAPGLDVLLRGLSMVRGDEEVRAAAGPVDGAWRRRGAGAVWAAVRRAVRVPPPRVAARPGAVMTLAVPPLVVGRT